MNILKTIDLRTAGKIFSSADNVGRYLIELNKKKAIGLSLSTISKGKNKGDVVLAMDNEELWKKVISSWDYKYALKIIRELFKKTQKYSNGKIAKKSYKELI